jgi:starvation-inducible DNA-binding protein
MEKNIENLHVILHGTLALRLKAQRCHWNVRGENFRSYHELFQDLYEELDDGFDEIGEQIRILDRTVEFESSRVTEALETLNSVARRQEYDMFEEGFEPDRQDLSMINHLYRLNKALSHIIENAIEDAPDASALEDFLIERKREHDFHEYMLQSHLEGR